jgi:hypothetical protein
MGASWLNQVEMCFSILEGQSLHAASFTSVAQVRGLHQAYNKTVRPSV